MTDPGEQSDGDATAEIGAAAETDAEMIRRARRTHGRAGAFIAAAGLGIQHVVEGRAKRDEGSVVVDAPTEPVDIDRDGLTVDVDATTSVVAPALPRRQIVPAPKRRRRWSR